ncbi:MAG: DNA translocase FtsK [Crocinitomicaceae bacterium]|jgi:DNA segregation ATPase FtsK/SpoIIIE, S-DNA-T family|nr:DNA translocase FtsK [Crocinitomicaceae bacterium]
MAADNQYKAKGTGEEKVTEKAAKPASQKKPSTIGVLKERFDQKKMKSTLGVILLLLAVYLFLANFSYLLTWQQDQNRVMSRSLFDVLFDGNEEPVANWLGKFGAWSSHLLIYRWFGLASFAIPLISFVIGFKMLFNIAILPVAKTISASILSIVWFSLFFGFFSKQVSYAGGAFGYQVNDWLKLSLGKFGALILILAFGYVIGMIVFNVNFSKIKNWFNNSKNDDLSEVNEEKDPNDMSVRNVIDPSQTTNELIAKTVHFEDEEDDDDEDGDFELTTHEIEDESDIIDEMAKEEDVDEQIEVDGLEVEVAATKEEDEELSEEEVESKRQEYGDYDPTLDLSSYALPPIDLLKDYGSSLGKVDKAELEENKNKIVTTLSNYKIDIEKIRATVGPTVTLYEIVPAPGVRISKIKNLEDDIALSLAALGIRIIAPIPGKGTIGIEVPNSKPEMVSMRSLIASKKFQESDYELPIVMGKTITNETFTFDLAKLPHLLVAGATGQGKSVGLNAILISLLYKKHPSQVKFVLVDPKKVELTLYNRIERHFLAKLPGEEEAIITDTSKVVKTLNSLCIEMDDRYELLKAAHVRNIVEYNQKFVARKLNPENGHRYLPYIVVLIDEFADLIMTAGKEVEHPIARIAQLARAIGIHLIVATQRPSVNVITGMIKANFPARIAFRVLSKIDSRTILDSSGADQLIGRGDMLISTGQDVIRLQCGFVDTPEVDDICAFIGDQRGYPEALLLPEFIGEGSDGGNGSMDDEELDALFADAARIVVMHQQGSASLLQRKLKLGYNRAGRIVDQLEGHGIIGTFNGSKARDVLFSDEVSLDEYLKSKGIF